MVNVETQISAVEQKAEEVRALLEQAVAVAVEGNMTHAEALMANAAGSLESVVAQVNGLCRVVDAARNTWVELSVR